MFNPSQIYIRTGSRVSKVYTFGKGWKIFGLCILGWMVLANVFFFGEIWLNRYIIDTNEKTGRTLDYVDYYDERYKELKDLVDKSIFLETAVASLADCKQPIDGILKGCEYE